MNVSVGGKLSAGGKLRPPADLRPISFFSRAWDLTHEVVIFTVGVLYSVFLGLFRCLRRPFQKPVSLKGRVCLVTGSGRGLGREICLKLAREGAVLACVDINEENNRETVRLVKDISNTVAEYQCNVANKSDVEELVKRVEAELGPIYLVMNNAAILLPPAEPDEAFVRASFNVNTMGPYWMIGAVLPYLERRNEGHLFSICSVASMYGVPVLDVYCATKAALRSIMQSTYLKLLGKGSNVKVSCVLPMPINTSADYTDSIDSRVRILPMKCVVADIMRLIRYGGFEVTVPHEYFYGMVLAQFMPVEAINVLLKFGFFGGTAPSNEEFKGSEPAKIVGMCAGEGLISKPLNGVTKTDEK